MSESLEAVFAGGDSEVAPETDATTTEQTSDEATSTETPEKTETDAKPDAKPETTEEHTVPVAAIQDERAKRQAAESRLSELEAAFAAQQQAKRKEPEPDLTEGLDFFGEPDKSAATLAERQQAQFESRLSAIQRDNAANLSLAVAKVRHNDFDTQVEAFKGAIKDDPTLVTQAENHPDPAEFIYQTGKRASQLAPFDGDLEKYKADVIAKYEAEQKASADKAERSKVPDSLNKESGSGGAETPPGPLSLKEILKR